MTVPVRVPTVRPVPATGAVSVAGAVTVARPLPTAVAGTAALAVPATGSMTSVTVTAMTAMAAGSATVPLATVTAAVPLPGSVERSVADARSAEAVARTRSTAVTGARSAPTGTASAGYLPGSLSEALATPLSGTRPVPGERPRPRPRSLPRTPSGSWTASGLGTRPLSAPVVPVRRLGRGVRRLMCRGHRPIIARTAGAPCSPRPN
ncbi:hypothetical protein GA0115242_102432 [Streptomyces sp. SolWspMP-5a-2]|nr:hypothetical protein GA0115242_102432 [Streptomyces sp. SolWspMP-5a-2]